MAQNHVPIENTWWDSNSLTGVLPTVQLDGSQLEFNKKDRHRYMTASFIVGPQT